MHLVILLSALPLLLSASGQAEEPWRMSRVADADASASPPRHKRYALRRKRWTRNRMRWILLGDHINDADSYIIRNTLHRAFNDWASVCSLQFEEVREGRAEIEVSFQRGHHSDRYPFDGPDGIVAHAFYPTDGRLHFDADEEWTLNQDNGTALHEIGHLMGLEHSSDRRAAMYAAKRPYSPEFALSDDDVRAARALFPLQSVSSSSSPSPPPSTTPQPSTATPPPSRTTVTHHRKSRPHSIEVVRQYSMLHLGESFFSHQADSDIRTH